jgi:hypothetical protein
MVIRRCKGWDRGHRFGVWKLLGVRRSRGLGVIVSDGMCKPCAQRMAARVAAKRARRA